MKWTTELPTEPGWYIVQFATSEDCFWLSRKTPGGPLFSGSSKGSQSAKAEKILARAVRWAGPIPEPE